MIKLLTAASTNGSGPPVTTDGGAKTLMIYATNFGAGTVTVEASPGDSTTWVGLAIAGSTAGYTGNAVRMVDFLAPGMQVRATLATSTGASNVNVVLF